MKKLILVLMVLTLAGAAQAEDIVLVNPGFEGAPDFTGWTTWSSGGNSYVDINTTEYYSGAKSGEFGSGPTLWNNPAGAYQEFPVDGSPISVGSMIKFRGWCKATGTDPYTVLKIKYIGGAGGYDEVLLANHAPTVGWVYGEATGLVPTGCTAVQLEVACFGTDGVGFFDDLEAEELPGDPWDPCDPNNMLKNHNYETAAASGGRLVPDFWNVYTLSDTEEYDHYQVADVTAKDGNDIWVLSDSNTCPDEEGVVGYQLLPATGTFGSGGVNGLYDTNSYNFSVWLRNPNMVDDAEVKIGFGYYEATGYEDFWGKKMDDVTVPKGNTWYQYSYSALKWLNSGKMSVRIEVHGSVAHGSVTIHVDDAVLHDLGVDQCGLAGREATEQIGYFPRLPGDLNGDCYVDFQDMEAVAEDWLESVIIP